MKAYKPVSRRQFMVGSVGAASLAVGAGSILHPGLARAAEIGLPLPCEASKEGLVLDPDQVRRYAFNHYFQGGCMHGAASGLMQAFKEAFADQDTGWDILPYGMYKYGAGGVAGWGTL